MKITKRLLVLASVSGLAMMLSGGVLAEGSKKSFDELDANRDGQLSKSEAASAAGVDFASADSDQNGMLSRSEYQDATSSDEM